MYTPVSNIVVTATMRWPGIGFIIATVLGLLSDSYAGTAVAWVASVAFSTYIMNKVFDGRLCSCKEKAISQGLQLAPKLNWIVEHHEYEEKRPWHLYFMFDSDESTKVHYASYATEDHAVAKQEAMQGMV